MRKHLDLILLLLFGVSLFSEIMVAIYLFIIAFPLLVAAKYSSFLGTGIISFAALRLLKRHFEGKAKEEG